MKNSIKRRSAIAHYLGNSCFKQRIVKSKKKYTRKVKHKNRPQ